MNFAFASAQQIIFGAGCAARLQEHLKAYGTRVFIASGSSPERYSDVIGRLSQQGFDCSLWQVRGEPSTDLVDEGVRKAREACCQAVVGIGGGSVMDAGKAVAAMLTNPGSLMDYLEGVGSAKPLTSIPAPFIAVPTTAGTGSEVTRNAVLESPQHHVKVSMRSPLMLPRLALVDPLLTVSMPPKVTAATGLDAFTQCLEPFVSNTANPLTDGFCREGLKRISGSIHNAYQDGSSLQVREDMALGSLLGGLALANAKLGAVHGIAGPFGGMFSAPHGAVCARLLPYVAEANVQALKSRDPGAEFIRRYDEIAQIITRSPDARAQDGIEWIQQITFELNIRPLSEYGFTRADIPILIEKSRNASSMKGNPVVLTDEELGGILEKSL